MAAYRDGDDRRRGRRAHRASSYRRSAGVPGGRTPPDSRRCQRASPGCLGRGRRAGSVGNRNGVIGAGRQTAERRGHRCPAKGFLREMGEVSGWRGVSEASAPAKDRASRPHRRRPSGRRSGSLGGGHRCDGRGRAIQAIRAQGQGSEDLTDRVRILHGRDQAQAPAAARACEHIDVERAA